MNLEKFGLSASFASIALALSAPAFAANNDIPSPPKDPASITSSVIPFSPFAPDSPITKLTDVFAAAPDRAHGKRIIFVEGEVDEFMEKTFIEKLKNFDAESTTQPIEIRIDSPGGSVPSMFKMYDQMQNTIAPIRTVGDGTVCSAATVLLAGGTTGMRTVTAHTEIMAHELSIYGGIDGGRLSAIESRVKESEIAENYMETILSEQTGQAVEKLHNLFHANLWLSANDAKELGLIDYIQQPVKTPAHPLHQPTTLPVTAVALRP